MRRRIPDPIVRARRAARRRRLQSVSEARFFAWAVTSEGRANRRRLAELKGRFAGRRCFVMGNGPTLVKCDLNRLRSEVTIASNAHYLIWDRISYRPTFLAAEDSLVLEDRAAELRSLTGPTAVFPFDARSLLGPAAQDRIYVNFSRHYPGFPRFSHRFDRRVYWGGTVSFLNLQLAAYLGCNPIVLIGFDHQYDVPREDVHDTVIHSRASDTNHFHPDYFGPGYRWHDPNVARMERAYELARVELEGRGVRVLNATVGGCLEVFERMPFDNALSAA